MTIRKGDDLEGDWASARVPRTATSPTMMMAKTRLDDSRAFIRASI
jgi:hypothetical protein